MDKNAKLSDEGIVLSDKIDIDTAIAILHKWVGLVAAKKAASSKREFMAAQKMFVDFRRVSKHYYDQITEHLNLDFKFEQVELDKKNRDILAGIVLVYLAGVKANHIESFISIQDAKNLFAKLASSTIEEVDALFSKPYFSEMMQVGRTVD